MDRVPILTTALTGPSEVSSCQPGLLAKVTRLYPRGLARFAKAAKEKEAAFLVGSQFAEIDRRIEEQTGVERLGLLVSARNRSWLGVDDKFFAVFALDLRVATS